MSPVVIGGTGGSGTRVVAQILERSGRFMGARLNHAHDALDLGDFDWQWGLRYLQGDESSAMRAGFERALESHLEGRPDGRCPWGWKHPHSYLLIPFLADRFAELRFLHVVRDSRAIALSSNVNQLRRYGELAGVAANDETPAARLRYWSWANLRAADHGQALLGAERYCQVRLEDLCARPESTIRSILAFTGDRYSPQLPALVRRPPDLERGLELAVPEDAAAALRRFGYQA